MIQETKRRLIICELMSEFHVAGALSYINHKKFDVTNSDFLMIVGYHAVSKGYRVNNEHFELLKGENTKIVYGKERPWTIIKNAIALRDYDEIVFIQVMSLNVTLIFYLRYILKIRNIKAVIIDEGIGMYMTPKIWKQSLKAEKNSSTLKQKENWIKLFRGAMLTFPKLIIKIFVYWSIEEPQRFQLFKMINGVLVKDVTVARAYKAFYEKNKAIRNSCETPHKHLHSSKILIVSDELVNSLVNPDDEIDIYQTILRLLRDKYPEFVLVFKPHPNELSNLEKFSRLKGCEILSDRISSEDLLAIDKSICMVVGESSTSLLSAAVIFNKKVISIIKYLYKFNLLENERARLCLFEMRVAGIKNIGFLI